MTTVFLPSVHDVNIVLGFPTHGKSPPRWRWARSLKMSLKAYVQNPSGLCSPVTRDSRPTVWRQQGLLNLSGK